MRGKHEVGTRGARGEPAGSTRIWVRTRDMQEVHKGNSAGSTKGAEGEGFNWWTTVYWSKVSGCVCAGRHEMVCCDF